MKCLSVLLCLFFVMMFAGCAQSTVKPLDSTADYGQPPKGYEAIIKKHLDTVLKDPSSLQVKQVTKPEKDFVYSALEKPHSYDLYADVTFTPVYGYKVCATYNAKNSYGGYAGFKTETFFFDSSGTFFVPTVIYKEFLSEMQRKGTYTDSSRLTTNPCK